MTTQTQPKRTRIKPLTDEQRKAVEEVIEQHDFQWWFDRRLVKDARERTVVLVGFPISPSAFRIARANKCEWFKVARRRRPSRKTALTWKEWERLRSAVKTQLHLLQGRSIREAVAIVSSVCRCNTIVLEGLSSDLHVWRKE